MFRDAYDFAKRQGELLRERTAAEQQFKLAADATGDSLRATLTMASRAIRTRWARSTRTRSST